MATNKTKPTKASVDRYLKTITDPARKKDCEELIVLMAEVTQHEPVMWGNSIIGFGSYRYEYASGRTGDWMVVGFSSRKQALTLYLSCNLDSLASQLDGLGTYTRGVGCLYIKRLGDIHRPTLKKLIRAAVRSVKK